MLARWASQHLGPQERAASTMYTSCEHCECPWPAITGPASAASCSPYRVSSSSPCCRPVCPSCACHRVGVRPGLEPRDGGGPVPRAGVRGEGAVRGLLDLSTGGRATRPSTAARGEAAWCRDDPTPARDRTAEEVAVALRPTASPCRPRGRGVRARPGRRRAGAVLRRHAHRPRRLQPATTPGAPGADRPVRDLPRPGDAPARAGRGRRRALACHQLPAPPHPGHRHRARQPGPDGAPRPVGVRLLPVPRRLRGAVQHASGR